ncbi:MAG: winged helix-turn-helix transcriptional regulator [Planctomycetes bacterium]|nr:winged helix-turn-helix transcriptional regulator [Planctomycetota bacterium]
MRDDQAEACAGRLKALADPNRLRLLNCLFAGPANVSNLCEQVGDDIVKVSHHLGVLRNAGLVQIERQGKHIIYSLHPDVLPAHKARHAPHTIDLGCCRLDLEESK